MTYGFVFGTIEYRKFILDGVEMKCCCYETETEFIYCVEGARGEIYNKLQTDNYWTKTNDDRFIKIYPIDTGWDDAWYLDSSYKEAVINNFARMGQSWKEIGSSVISVNCVLTGLRLILRLMIK